MPHNHKERKDMSIQCVLSLVLTAKYQWSINDVLKTLNI